MAKNKNIKIAVIGAGFGGLSIAYRLAKFGFSVTVFELNKKPGGLAIGLKKNKWKWSLEEHYHHLFLTDKSILNLAKEINHKIVIRRPKTSTFYRGDIEQIDSPVSLLLFKHMSFFSKVRTGLCVAALKAIPFVSYMETVSAQKFLKAFMGEESWKVLWGPLLSKKFGKHASVIPASWFWARVKTRTAKLAYPKGGFLALAETLVKRIKAKKGRVYFGAKIISINQKKNSVVVSTDKSEYEFDKVISTLPSYLSSKIIRGLPKNYFSKMLSKRGLGAINLVLSLKSKFFTDDTYWLNVNEKKYPFLCVVEHTNFMDSKDYNKECVLYIGKYIDVKEKDFNLDAKQTLSKYLPYLKEISPNFTKSKIKNAQLFKANFAQPIITSNYSKRILPLRTPLRNIYIANIEQVYPWDRGTNYAVELGEKLSSLVIEDSMKL